MTPLFAKLTEMLGVEVEPETPDVQAAPVQEDALSDGIRDELQKAQKVVTLLTKQALALNDRFTLLRAACEAVRLLPVTGVGAPAGHAPQLPALVALLRDDREAAKLVASAVLRFADLRADVAELTSALQRGESKPERLEAIKGKHAFLPRIHLYFQGVPLLAALFQVAAPAAPAGAPAPAAAPPIAIKPGQGASAGDLKLAGGTGQLSGIGLGSAGTGTLGRATSGDPHPAGSPRPQTQGLPPPARRTAPVGSAGPDQLVLAPRTPPRASSVESPPLASRAPALLRALEVKIAILQGAWALAQIPPVDGPKLPAVLAPTVKAAAAVLAGDAGLRGDAAEAVAAFHRAKALLLPGSPAGDRGDLPRLLTLLATLPARFRDVPALGPLFA